MEGKVKIEFVCYKTSGLKLGVISITTDLTDPKEVFRINKEAIKRKYPGTAFIKKNKVI